MLIDGVDSQVEEHKIRLFVGNLAWDISEDEIFNHCGKHEAIADIEIKRFKNNNSRGWGLLYLKKDASYGDGQDIIDAHNFTILKDRKIHIKFDRYNDDNDKVKLYVGNIPWSYNENDIKTVLKDYNPISVKVTTNMCGKSRGYALVQFENPDTVAAVIKENEGTVWSGRKIIFKVDNRNADTDALTAITSHDSLSHED